MGNDFILTPILFFMFQAIPLDERQRGFLNELHKILKDETIDVADRVYLYEFTDMDLRNFKEVFDEFREPIKSPGDKHGSIIGLENLQQSLAIVGIPFPMGSGALGNQIQLPHQKKKFLPRLEERPDQLTFKEFVVHAAAWRYHMVAKETFEQAYEIFLRSGTPNPAEGVAKSIDEKVLHTISKALGENIDESEWQHILTTCIKKSNPESSSNSFSKEEFVSYCLEEQDAHFKREMQKVTEWADKPI